MTAGWVSVTVSFSKFYFIKKSILLKSNFRTFKKKVIGSNKRNNFGRLSMKKPPTAACKNFTETHGPSFFKIHNADLAHFINFLFKENMFFRVNVLKLQSKFLSLSEKCIAWPKIQFTETHSSQLKLIRPFLKDRFSSEAVMLKFIKML